MTAVAQVKKSSKSAEFRTPRVKDHGRKAKTICPLSKRNAYPYQGIGFKLGDPFAVTYKFYPSKRWAFVADVGIAASGLSNHYYKKLFSKYVPDELEKNISHLGHEVPSDWCFQVKALHQWKIHSIFKGLHVYTGLGWQWRLTQLKYGYTYTTGEPDTENITGKILIFETPRFTFGGIALVGFEYTHSLLPISAFLETELFVDVFADPGYRAFQGGIGVRYIF